MLFRTKIFNAKVTPKSIIVYNRLSRSDYTIDYTATLESSPKLNIEMTLVLQYILETSFGINLKNKYIW